MGLFSKKDKKDNQADNEEKPIESYRVVYKGGLPQYPKASIGAINLNIYVEGFMLTPTLGSKWFKRLAIPYKNISDVKIVGRQVSFTESMLGGLNSRQLNQDNNINISFTANERKFVLRLEMLTGISVMGQAKKCREFEDRLMTHGIRDKFAATSAPTAAPTATAGNGDVVERLKELNTLRQQGILTDAEFSKAKQRLLG